MMSVVTLEGIVDRGQIRLKDAVNLPDRAKVYVIVPDLQVERIAHIASPRLKRPEQATDFRMEVVEEEPDARV